MFELILLALITSLGLQIESGQAAYYAPQVMERVVRVRQAGWTAGPLPEELPPVIGFVATPYCHEIGDRLWLWHESEGWMGPYLVSDCCDEVAGHCHAMRRKGIVIEVDYNTAMRWDVWGLGPEHIDVMVAKIDDRP